MSKTYLFNVRANIDTTVETDIVVLADSKEEAIEKFRSEYNTQRIKMNLASQLECDCNNSPELLNIEDSYVSEEKQELNDKGESYSSFSDWEKVDFPTED